MGLKLFGVDIAGEVAKALGPSFLSFVLIKVKAGTRTTGDLAAGVDPKTSPNNCKGILDSYHERQIDGTLIKAGDRKALLLGDTLPSGVIPEPNDRITAEGITFQVMAVSRDPDAATYTCQVRR